MYIVIGGDLVPTHSNTHLFSEGKVEELFGSKLCKLVKDADYSIFNLETPLIDDLYPIKKCGPCLSAPINSVNAFQRLGIKLISLANNHIMDQGSRGLESTIKALKNAGIEFTGVVDNCSESQRYKVIDIGLLRLGIISFAEHEFSIATKKSPGANPFDIYNASHDIARMKNESDFIIVLYHGGKEYYRYPSPNLQKNCRLLIDLGADLVICQHSHCLGCEESYNDKKIIYGQGNFCFDRVESGKDDYWNSGCLVRIDFETSKAFTISYIPIKKCAEVVRIMDEEESEKTLNDFMSRSNEIKDESKVEEEFKQFVADSRIDYFVGLSSKESFLFRLINKVLKNRLRNIKYKVFYPESKMLTILNYVECESHREMIVQLLRDELHI